jgi:hypothetical protein
MSRPKILAIDDSSTDIELLRFALDRRRRDDGNSYVDFEWRRSEKIASRSVDDAWQPQGWSGAYRSIPRAKPA